MWSKMYIGLHVKYPLFLSDFKEMQIFLTDFSKDTQISNFMKIRSVGAELFHAERQTDMRRLKILFRNFSSAPKKEDVFFPPSNTTTYFLPLFKQSYMFRSINDSH